jgi:copper chaperone
MKTIILETNLQCSHCVRRIKSFLDEIIELNTWEVDDNHPKKRIIAQGSDKLTAEKMIKAIDEAGYEALECANH